MVLQRFMLFFVLFCTQFEQKESMGLKHRGGVYSCESNVPSAFTMLFFEIFHN